MDEITPGLYRLGNAHQPAFLLLGKQRSIQIDAGPAYMGPTYLKDVRKLLGEGKGPDLILFTHLHFDHVGAAPHLLRRFPRTKLGGSESFRRLLDRKNVIATVTLLNRRLAKKHGYADALDPQDFEYGRLKMNIILEDGDTVDLGGGCSIEVLATPGHTRDSLSFFLPHNGVVLPGEALGIIPGDDSWVAPQFLSSYHDYVRSIERVRKKGPEVVVLAHHRILKGEEIRHFFDTSLSDCRAYRQMIERYLRLEHMNATKVIQRIKQEQYSAKRRDKQPEEAYLLNLQAQVKLVSRMMIKG